MVAIFTHTKVFPPFSLGTLFEKGVEAACLKRVSRQMVSSINTDLLDSSSHQIMSRQLV